MSFTLFFLAVTLSGSIFYSSNAKADSSLPAYDYTKTFDVTNGSAQANGVATDNSGDTFVTGTCQGTVIFDGTGGSDSQFCGIGNGSGFLTKYNPDGSYGWTKIIYDYRYGGVSANSVAVDSAGDIYVAGDCDYNITFDGSGGSDTQTCGTDNYVPFLTKYNPDGSYGWTKVLNTTEGAAGRANSVTVDNNNNVYLTGNCSGSIIFDANDDSDTQDCGQIDGGEGATSVFITRYNADGSYGWTRMISNTGTVGNAVTSDSGGDVFVAGTCNGSVTFDATDDIDTQTCGGDTGGGVYTSDAFLTKYNSDGTYVWTKIFSNDSNSMASADGLTTDSSGDIYMTGNCSGSVTFDGIGGSDTQDCGVYNPYNNSDGNSDTYLTKYNSDGSYGWTKVTSSTISSGATGGSVAIDSSGNIYVSGSCFGSITFDGIGGSDTQDCGTIDGYFGGADYFITKYNPDGTYAWTRTANTLSTSDSWPYNGYAGSSGIAIDGSNNIHMAGNFMGTVTFDGCNNADTQTNNNGNPDVYLTEYSPSGGNACELQIDTNYLPDGQIAESYSQQTQVQYESASDYTISSGSLPPGLSLNPSSGLISGTPNTVGYYDFTISAVGGTSGYTATSQPLFINIDGYYLAQSEIGQTDGDGNIDWTQGDDSPQAINNPTASVVDTVNHRLFVSDSRNNRVLVYPLNDQDQEVSQTPIYELGQGTPGQADFSDTNCSTTQNSLCTPTGLAFDSTHDRLFVVDSGNERVMVFNVDPSTIQNGENAENVIGAPDYTDTSSCTTNQTSICSDTWQPYDGVGPQDLAYDATNNRLFVTDTTNNRVLVFNADSNYMNQFANGNEVSQPAEYELGQGSVGQADFTDNAPATSQNGLDEPDGLAYDAANSRLFVSDGANNRVLIFNVAPSDIQDGENATYELGQGTPGQADFTDNQNNEGQNGFSNPEGLAYDPIRGQLYVQDTVNDNRVLIFDVTPSDIQNDENAEDVIGQSDYDSDVCTTTQYNFCYTDGSIDIDPVNRMLYVPDTTNSRIMIFQLATLVDSSDAPGGVVGDNYSFSTGNYYQGLPNFSLTSGSLPPGTVLDPDTGVVSGIPTTSGDYTFTISLSDVNGPNTTFSDSQTYTVPISEITNDTGGGSGSSSGGSTSPPATTVSKPSSPVSSNPVSAPISGSPTSNAPTVPIDLDSQPPYVDGTGYTNTAGSGQTYTYSPTSTSNTTSTITVTKVIPPKTVELNVGGTNVITIQTGQTVTENSPINNKPVLKITLNSVSGSKASLTFVRVKLASYLAPVTSSAKAKPSSHHGSFLKAILLVFPWLLFVLLGLISLNFIYRAYQENQRIKHFKTQLAWVISLSEQKQNFVTLSSHYFRTPLTLISSGIELATDNASYEIRQDFKVMADNLKQAIEQLIATVTAPIVTAAPAVISNQTIETESKGLSSYLVSFIFCAYAVVGLSYLILDKLNLYDVKLVTILEQIAAIALVSLLSIGARSSYRKNKQINENNKELLDEQTKLDDARNDIINQALLVLNVPLSQVRTKLLALDPALTKPALNGVSRLDSMLKKFSLITLLKADTEHGVHGENVDFVDLLKEILPRYDATIKAKQLNIKTEFEVPNVYQNKPLLAEALDTLVSNAVKYSPEHSSVTIAAYTNGDQVDITVADQGIGIAKDKLSQIFQPFSRAEDAAKDFNQEGMGLSLYLDKLIAQYLGGSIDIGSSGLSSTNHNPGTTARLAVSGQVAS